MPETCDRTDCGATRAEYDRDPCTREVCGLRDDVRPDAVADQAGETLDLETYRGYWGHMQYRQEPVTLGADSANMLGRDIRRLCAEVERLTRERDDMAKTIRALVKPEGEARPTIVQAVLASVVGYVWRDPTTGAETVLAREDVRLVLRDDGSGT